MCDVCIFKDFGLLVKEIKRLNALLADRQPKAESRKRFKKSGYKLIPHVRSGHFRVRDGKKFWVDKYGVNGQKVITRAPHTVKKHNRVYWYGKGRSKKRIITIDSYTTGR